MISKSFFFIFTILFMSQPLLAKIKVVTTLSDLASLVETVGGPYVEVKSICNGRKDPHFLNPRPPDIILVREAKLVVANSLGLESAWLPKILSSAGNFDVIKHKTTEGFKGFLEVGDKVSVLDVPKGQISRAQGDVHIEGNPHVTLDPIRVGEISVMIAEKLSQLDPKNSETYNKNAQKFQKRMKEKTKEWLKRIEKTGITSVVTYHETLAYFLDRFHLKCIATLEPFPGIPPTAKHTLKVIKEASEQGTKLILIEHYYDSRAAEKPASQIPGVHIARAPVAVQKPEIPNNEALFEALVKIIEHHRIVEDKKPIKKELPEKKDKPKPKPKKTASQTTKLNLIPMGKV